MKKQKKPEPMAVGGEALLEGIMMRGPAGAAVALRLPNGSIETEMKRSTPPGEKHPFLRWPLVRGPVSFVYSMVFGYKCMMESAEKVTAGTMEGMQAEGKIDRWIEQHFGPKMMAVLGVAAGVIGVALALGLFVLAPEKIAGLIQKHSGVSNRFLPLMAGSMRIVLFVGYMALVSLLKDIRRVFQYHGAEHKSIFCYENGLELTVENVRAQSRFHPRCGTSFLFVIILLSILISSLLMIFPALAAFLTAHIWARVLRSLILLPVIMAFGYEFNRFAGKHLKNPVVRVLAAPGLAMQRITTKEPDEDIIAVGIQSLKAALGMEYDALVPANTQAPEEAPLDDDTLGDRAGGEDAAG